MPSQRYGGRFRAKLVTYGGTGAWFFAPVPRKYAPRVTHAWGRTPVLASVDGHEWKTSVWHTKTGATLLAVPKHIRGSKREGDSVMVEIAFDSL